MTNEWMKNYPSVFVTRFYEGDKERAKIYYGEGNKLLYQLKNLMTFRNLGQLKMTRLFTDGTKIIAKSVYGHDEIYINSPFIEAEVVAIDLFLVFYVYNGVVMVTPVDLRSVDSINASNITPKVASDLGFSIDMAKPFSTIQRPFSHQGQTIHLTGSAIKFDGDYISGGGETDGWNTLSYYAYDLGIGKYYYLGDSYDTAYDLNPVFNVNENQIYISVGEWWGVNIYKYVDGVVTFLGNKLPSDPEYYRTIAITENGDAYYREPDADPDHQISGYSTIVDVPLIRSLSGIKIVITKAIVGQKYNIDFYLFRFLGVPFVIFTNELTYYEGGPLGGITYTAVEGDTTQIIAAKMAEQINITTQWAGYGIRWPATASDNEIIITENFGSTFSYDYHIGVLQLDGPMVLFDYYPNLLGTTDTTIIRTYNLLDDSTELFFTEFLSGSTSGNFNLNYIINIQKVYNMFFMRGTDPSGYWPWLGQFDMDYAGSYSVKKKNERITSGNSGLSLDFIDEDILGEIDQEAHFLDTGVIPDPPPNHETVDATVDELLSQTRQFGSLSSFSNLVDHHTIRHTYFENGTFDFDLSEDFNINKDDGYVEIINFPFSTTDASLFYEVYNQSHEIDTEGSISGDEVSFNVVRGSPPGSEQVIGSLITPYEEIVLLGNIHFSYGWTHLQDSSNGVLIQGLQLLDEDQDIYVPILYSNGVRIEEVLSTKLGCVSSDIMGIVYYPGFEKDPQRSIFK